MDIIQYLKNNPNMVAIDITTGFSDIEVEFHVIDINQLENILDNLSEKFQDVIRNYSYSYIKKSHKLFYFPEI
jgi:carboxypeptidase C (cathepsin A)